MQTLCRPPSSSLAARARLVYRRRRCGRRQPPARIPLRRIIVPRRAVEPGLQDEGIHRHLFAIENVLNQEALLRRTQPAGARRGRAAGAGESAVHPRPRPSRVLPPCVCHERLELGVERGGAVVVEDGDH
eukprot:scaffold32778_cov146-Isochrysis_galbana.AAC.2